MKAILEEKDPIEELYHYGVLGMKWGVRNEPESTGRKRPILSEGFRDKADAVVKSIGAKINPRELKYGVRKIFNKVDSATKRLANASDRQLAESGLLTTSKTALKAVESVGIERHKKTKYDNLTDTDIANFKRYTDSARFSRNVNSFLAINEPKVYGERARQIKESLSKNSVDNMTVYRSCALKFSMNKTHGLAKKLDEVGEAELQQMFDKIARNYKGKSRSESRIFSTSTSPLFAIDTWREVNPTAAASYNCYMVINCKKTPGILADATTRNGQKLVNTRSNQEAILAPNKLTYRNLRWDKRRKMFALSVDAS